MQPSDTPGAAGTCSDCPPVGYPTDATRCLPCPRRGAPQNVLTPGATEIEAAVAWAKERVTWPTPWEAFVVIAIIGKATTPRDGGGNG